MTETEISKIVARVVERLLEPFSSLENFGYAISNGVRAFISLNGKLAWLYLLSSILIAWFIFVFEQRKDPGPGKTSFWTFLFPRSIYHHPSAIVDYKFVALDLSVSLVVYVPFIAGLSDLFYKAVEYLFANIISVPAFTTMSDAGMLTLFIAAFLIGDFQIFLAHYLVHKIPVLWQFHKVHHSAEVLTPITVLRGHPVDNLMQALVVAISSAVMASTFGYVSGKATNYYTILGINTISFFFFIIASQLRHSHVWLSYGPFCSYIFISPAQHQIHHSTDPKHWNKNYGFVLAIWDWLFRSLYVPRQRERLNFGLPGGESKEFASVAKLYFLPFAKAARELSKSYRPAVLQNDSKRSA